MCHCKKNYDRARLDADKKAQPKTRLITRVNPKHCIPYGGVGAYATEYEDENGNREVLK